MSDLCLELERTATGRPRRPSRCSAPPLNSAKRLSFYHTWCLALGVVALLASCAPETPPNVVLISIDTLRADYVNADTTPNLMALAEEGVRFERVLSPIPLTLPAHSSMLTGALPPTHGMHDNLSYKLDDAHVTLAERLSREGYATGGIISSFVLDAQFNLDQGFQDYNDTFEEEHKIAFLSERKGDEATRLADAWLRRRDGTQPFFLFLHYYDPHDDYAPPEPYAARFKDDLYAGEVAFTDDNVGRILETLKTIGAYDDTIIVVTGDHGEMLGEHEELTHGFFVYESALRVPLIIKAPDVGPVVVDDWVSLADVAPTIAGLLELDFPELDGVNLAPFLRGRGDGLPRRELYAESLTPDRYYDANPLFALVTDEFKYIHTTRPELYNLETDPAEASNLVAQEPRIAEGMRAALESILVHAESGAASQLDDEAMRRLSSLGYLSGGSTSGTLALDPSKDDPKDWIAFYRDHQELEHLVNEGEYESARALGTKMLDAEPGFPAVHIQLARAATEDRDLETATSHYLSALQGDPDNAGAHYNVANLLAARGLKDDARGHYERALELDPGMTGAEERLARLSEEDAAGPHRLGLEARERGDVDTAIRELQRAVALNPEFAEAHNDLGVTLKNVGRVDEALQHYRKAIAIDPDFALAHNNMGSLLGSRGDVAGAIDHFRKAVAARPDYAEAHNNLGLALRMTGKRDEAIPHFRAALAARGDWPVPMNELAWILATHSSPAMRNPPEALALARRAAELTDARQPVILDTLAASLAATGQYEQAVKASERAIAIASERAPALANEMRSRLELYRVSQPYVEPEGARAAPGR